MARQPRSAEGVKVEFVVKAMNGTPLQNRSSGGDTPSQSLINRRHKKARPMPSRFVDCPLCGGKLELGFSAPAEETFATCPTCLSTLIVGPVGDSYQARLPGGPYPKSSQLDAFDMPASSTPATGDVATPHDAMHHDTDCAFESIAREKLENNWGVQGSMRRVARTSRRVLQRIRTVVFGPVSGGRAFVNMLRKAMATHPITTMIWSFVTAVAIGITLLAMWLIVIRLTTYLIHNAERPVSRVSSLKAPGGSGCSRGGLRPILPLAQGIEDTPPESRCVIWSASHRDEIAPQRVLHCDCRRGVRAPLG